MTPAASKMSTRARQSMSGSQKVVRPNEKRPAKGHGHDEAVLSVR
jgi:hypothetical protein